MRRLPALITAAALSAVCLTACGPKEDAAAPVQSVAMLTGLMDVMEQQVFAGVVSTGNEANVKKDGNKKVAKVYVKKGDIVKVGDKLFTYDAEQAQNSLDKAKLELEEKKNALLSRQEEKKQLEADKQKAKQEDQLDYTLKIQETDTDIREIQYNIGLKEKEILKLEEGTKNLDVTAPIEGRVEKVGQADSSFTDYSADDEDDLDYESFDVDDMGSSSEVFIKLVEVDNYRIKGTIDETNISQISAGMEMVIHSRVDDSRVWKGVVSEVDYKTPDKNQGSTSYYSDEDDTEMTNTSKYPFYVKIDALEGLIIGQHVYMTEDIGLDSTEGINLSSAFINDPEGDAWVWAEKDGKLEKRSVVLGLYIEEEDVYEVKSGLTMDDFIALPNDSYHEGMDVTENSEENFEADAEAGEVDFYDSDSFDDTWSEEDWDDETWSEEEDLDYDTGDEVDIAELEAAYRAAGEEIVG